MAATTSPNMFTIDDIVLIDEKYKAYISSETVDFFFRVQFIIDKTKQINILDINIEWCQFFIQLLSHSAVLLDHTTTSTSQMPIYHLKTAQ